MRLFLALAICLFIMAVDATVGRACRWLGREL